MPATRRNPDIERDMPFRDLPIILNSWEVAKWLGMNRKSAVELMVSAGAKRATPNRNMIHINKFALMRYQSSSELSRPPEILRDRIQLARARGAEDALRTDDALNPYIDSQLAENWEYMYHRILKLKESQ